MVLSLLLAILVTLNVSQTVSNNSELVLVLNLNDHTITYRRKCLVNSRKFCLCELRSPNFRLQFKQSILLAPVINITISEAYSASHADADQAVIITATTLKSTSRHPYSSIDPKVFRIDTGNITNLQQSKLQECKGYDNFIVDIGIVSFILGGFSSLIGIYTLVLSLIEQFISYISQYYVSVPAIFFLVFPNITSSQPLLSQLSMVNTNLGMLDTIVNSIIGLPLNDHINFASAFDEVLGLISLCIGTWSTFPDVFEELLDNLFGVKVHKVFEGYGC